jgi:hypothetical protein
MSKLDRCPNCQNQRLADISGLYSGWEAISDRLQLCYNCQKCWGYSNNGKVVDLTGSFEDAAGEALTEALDKFLNDDFPEQKK